MKRKGYLTKNVAVTIRYKDRRTISRSKKFTNPIMAKYFSGCTTFIHRALEWKCSPAFRITGQDLVEEDSAFKQLDIFTYEKEAKKEPLYKAIDSSKENMVIRSSKRVSIHHGSIKGNNDYLLRKFTMRENIFLFFFLMLLVRFFSVNINFFFINGVIIGKHKPNIVL